jgi:hypothetical protein
LAGRPIGAPFSTCGRDVYDAALRLAPDHRASRGDVDSPGAFVHDVDRRLDRQRLENAAGGLAL